MIIIKSVKGFLKTASLIVFSFLFINEVNSQKSNQFEFTLAPTLSHRDLRETSFDYSIGLRYDLGINYRRLLSKKVSIGIGLGYSDMGYNLLDFHAPDTNIIRDNKIYRNFIELPLLLSYEFYKSDNKRLLIDLNFVNQLFVSQAVKVKDNYENEYKQTITFNELKNYNYDLYNIALQVRSTYLQNFDNNFIFKISPFFKYGFLSLNNIHDLSFGLMLGLGYNF